jgi:hypothetical protein
LAGIRIHQKKRIRLHTLTFKQLAMVKIGRVGLAEVKRRVAAAMGPNDEPARPLKDISYKKQKRREGLPAVRDLHFSGEMMRNLTLRTVTDKSATAAFTSRKQRAKARANQNIEPFVVFSPKNAAVVRQATDKELRANVKAMVVETWLGSAKP